ncbi:MAG TPA: hypothetical protein VLE96_00405 [Chlamydiales bacterium]|nr:hypothetical protein [Chlamydiales bacterium]
MIDTETMMDYTEISGILPGIRIPIRSEEDELSVYSSSVFSQRSSPDVENVQSIQGSTVLDISGLSPNPSCSQKTDDVAVSTLAQIASDSAEAKPQANGNQFVVLEVVSETGTPSGTPFVCSDTPFNMNETAQFERLAVAQCQEENDSPGARPLVRGVQMDMIFGAEGFVGLLSQKKEASIENSHSKDADPSETASPTLASRGSETHSPAASPTVALK